MTQAATAPAQRVGEDVRFIRTRFEAVPLPIPEDDTAPSRIKIAPWGEFDLRDKKDREAWGLPGTFEIGKRSAAEISKNFERRDIDHSVNERHFGGRALGWLEAVEVVKNDGVYLVIDWTEEGRALLESRAYRYGSGEWVLDVSEWLLNEGPAYPIAITGFALTNTPAVKGFEPIMTETLDAALSGSDGRSREGEQPSGDTGQKGECRMDGTNFWKGLFTRVAGKEPVDEVEAATMAAELKKTREESVQLKADVTAASTKVTELTEQLTKANTKISEFEAADKDRLEKDQDGQIKAAVTAGKIAPTQVEWAKANFESFLSLVAAVEDGAVGPPKGQQVSDKAIGSADTATLSGDADNKALDAEIKTHMAKNKVAYHEAWLAVKAERSAAGTGV